MRSARTVGVMSTKHLFGQREERRRFPRHKIPKCLHILSVGMRSTQDH